MAYEVNTNFFLLSKNIFFSINFVFLFVRLTLFEGDDDIVSFRNTYALSFI